MGQINGNVILKIQDVVKCTETSTNRVSLIKLEVEYLLA